MDLDRNKADYWNSYGINYDNTWKSRTKSEMSKREMDFINKYLRIFQPKNVLDIGIGTGRILDNLIKNVSNNTKIYGIDLTKSMVLYCKEKFIHNKKIKLIKTCDISKEPFNFKETFDFITAIRVLKYNKNWQQILKKIYKKLDTNGVLIFTMPNYYSVNRFAKLKIPIYRTTVNELKPILEKTGFKLMEIGSFSKLPDILYDRLFPNSYLYSKALIFIEKVLELILGKTFLGRMLFIAVKK